MQELLLALAALAAASAASAATLEIPSDYPDFASAYAAASDGDVIEFAPGTHVIPAGFTLDKQLTLASWYETRNDPDAIDATILVPPNPGNAGLTFAAGAFGSRVVGLTFGDFRKPISSFTHQDILWNHFLQCRSDQVDLEAGGGGTIAHNIFDNSGDDGIDLDFDTQTVIEHNIIRNPDDDGIEIRLHDNPPRTTVNEIRYNVIIGAGEDGIQLIDYDSVTPREYFIHHNVIADSVDAGIGCMDGGITAENLGGCAMPELVVIYNNTIVGNAAGITGGDNMFVVNNIVADNPIGIRRVDGGSVVAHTLVSNGTNFESTNLGSGVLVAPPEFDGDDYELSPGSPAVDAGVLDYVSGGRTLFELDALSYSGAAPDLGALELGGAGDPGGGLSISAGADFTITGTATATLQASLSGAATQISWTLENGPGAASFGDASAARTDVTFSVQGRYTLRVEASNADALVSDTLVVTFAAEERERSFAISAPATLFFEAEDYTLRVGEALASGTGSGASGNAFVYAEAAQDPAYLEFDLVLTSEGFGYYVWVRMMQVSEGDAQLGVSLDDGSEQQLTTDATTFRWVRIDQPIPSPAGAYPLRLRASQDGTAWDAVYVTSDPGFAPADARPAAPILLP